MRNCSTTRHIELAHLDGTLPTTTFLLQGGMLEFCRHYGFGLVDG
jgi:hypothetical protein